MDVMSSSRARVTPEPLSLLHRAERTHQARLDATTLAALPHPDTCQALLDFSRMYRLVSPRLTRVHPLVLSSASRLSSDGFLSRGGDRLSSLANTTSIFHMTHIAKTGGRSVKYELNRLVLPVLEPATSLWNFYVFSRVSRPPLGCR